jgi:hypothetical protein
VDKARPYLKVAALASSILLVAAFVGCRSGALQMFSKPEPMPEPHPLGLNMPNPPADQSPAQPTFMPGAKSMALSGVTIGLTPAGTNAPDLDVPVRQPMNPPTPNAPRP